MRLADHCAVSRRAQRHQLQPCPQFRAGDWRRHCRVGGRGRGIRHECASLSAPSDRLVPLVPRKGAVSAAARKNGARRYFGRSLDRALAANSNRPWTDLGYRDCRRIGLSAHAACRARPPAWRRPNLRRHVGGVWHGRGDWNAQYFHASRAPGRRSFDPPVHDRHGRLCRSCRVKSLVSSVRKRARLRGRRLDSFGHGIQCRHSTCRSPLGRWSFTYSKECASFHLRGLAGRIDRHLAPRQKGLEVGTLAIRVGASSPTPCPVRFAPTNSPAAGEESGCGASLRAKGLFPGPPLAGSGEDGDRGGAASIDKYGEVSERAPQQSTQMDQCAEARAGGGPWAHGGGSGPQRWPVPAVRPAGGVGAIAASFPRSC